MEPIREADVQTQPGKRLAEEPKRKKVGKGWTPAASWPIDAVGQVGITKTYNGTTGTTYRTRVVITTGVDEIDVASNERTV